MSNEQQRKWADNPWGPDHERGTDGWEKAHALETLKQAVKEAREKFLASGRAGDDGLGHEVEDVLLNDSDLFSKELLPLAVAEWGRIAAEQPDYFPWHPWVAHDVWLTLKPESIANAYAAESAEGECVWLEVGRPVQAG